MEKEKEEMQTNMEKCAVTGKALMEQMKAEGITPRMPDGV